MLFCKSTQEQRKQIRIMVKKVYDNKDFVNLATSADYNMVRRFLRAETSHIAGVKFVDCEGVLLNESINFEEGKKRVEKYLRSFFSPLNIRESQIEILQKKPVFICYLTFDEMKAILNIHIANKELMEKLYKDFIQTHELCYKNILFKKKHMLEQTDRKIDADQVSDILKARTETDGYDQYNIDFFYARDNKLRCYNIVSKDLPPRPLSPQPMSS